VLALGRSDLDPGHPAQFRKNRGNEITGRDDLQRRRKLHQSMIDLRTEPIDGAGGLLECRIRVFCPFPHHDLRDD
jgi:hypothetical protein